MGECVDISIRKKSLWWFKNYLDMDIVNLFFSKKDLLVTPEYKEDPDDEDSVPFTRYMFKTTVKNARERLDARGFSLNKLEKIFSNEEVFDVIDYTSFLYHLNVDSDNHEETARRRISKYVTFQKWMNSMKKIVYFELMNGNIQHNDNADVTSIPITTECDKVIFYALKDFDSESFYALRPGIVPHGYVFRLILEYCDLDEEISLDFSALSYWSDDSIPNALAKIDDVEKTIVLLEGTSDKDIIEFAMTHLYPHLADLYYFMDFEDNCGGKREGGTSFVIKNLKTFYFSKIKSKFIAIFDNDAEGYQSQCILLTEIKNWPENFRILLYPEIKEFHKYPTLASNGTIIEDNINKKACSIELYLPNSLIMSAGNLIPIEWEARKKIKTQDGKEVAVYQGVISQKSEIKQNFHDLRKQIEADENLFVTDDWARIKKLIETIIFAFN